MSEAVFAVAQPLRGLAMPPELSGLALYQGISRCLPSLLPEHPTASPVWAAEVWVGHHAMSPCYQEYGIVLLRAVWQRGQTNAAFPAPLLPLQGPSPDLAAGTTAAW